MIIMKENMVVIIDLKNFYFDFDLTKDVDENLKYEIEFIVKSNKYLDENKIKSEIEQYCPNTSMEVNVIMNINKGNIKENEPRKFALNLLQKLNLRSSNEDVALQTLSIYYT